MQQTPIVPSRELVRGLPSLPPGRLAIHENPGSNLLLVSLDASEARFDQFDWGKLARADSLCRFSDRPRRIHFAAPVGRSCKPSAFLFTFDAFQPFFL
jgi:hypothetical protein